MARKQKSARTRRAQTQTQSQSSTAHKRSSIEIERDRQEIATLYLRGDTQAQIAARLSSTRDYNLTQQLISYDLGVIRSRWLDSMLRDFDELKAQELAKVDTLEVEYWSAWERSKGAREETVTERISRAATSANKKSVPLRDRAAVRKMSQFGDTKYLDGVQWCIERRCAILGLDAPSKHSLTDVEGKALSQTWREIVVHKPADYANPNAPASTVDTTAPAVQSA